MTPRAEQPRAAKSRTPARLATLSTVALAAGLTVASPTQGDAHGRREPAGRATRTIALKENGYLRSVRRQGSVLDEQGREYGTFNAPLYIRLTVSYTKSTFTFTTSPKGGTISGAGRATFYVSGVIAHFSGVMWITRGTGAYAHVSAPSLQISGTLQRKTYALTTTFGGAMRM